MQTYVAQNDVFLHDIVESFSSMINVAFVIFFNSPTASSIVPSVTLADMFYRWRREVYTVPNTGTRH